MSFYHPDQDAFAAAMMKAVRAEGHRPAFREAPKAAPKKKYRDPQVTIRGVTYATCKEAATALGVCTDTVYYARRFGKLDEVGLVTATEKKVTVIDGVVYASMTEAAKALGVTRQSIAGMVRRGGERKMQHMVPVTIRGVSYPSMSAAARQLGLTPDTIRQAWKKGKLDRVGMRGGPSTECVFNGKSYPSIRAAARAEGVADKTMRNWIEAGKATT